jgi:hypothetical protein
MCIGGCLGVMELIRYGKQSSLEGRGIDGGDRGRDQGIEREKGGGNRREMEEEGERETEERERESHLIFVRRVIPAFIVGADSEKLKKMDATVHIFYGG